MSALSHDQVQDLLPAYVLGALERDEEAAVREHLASCQLHDEVAELGGTVHYLAEIVEPVEPPAALKARILAAAAEADLEARRAGAVPAAIAAPAPMRPQPAVVPTVERPRLRLTWGWAMQAAAVIAVIALGAWNLNLQSRVGGLENEVADARAYERALDDVLTVAILPGSQTAVLGPAEGGPSMGLAAIRADGSIVLAMRGLDPTVGSEVYEAWVIVGDAAPQPVGGFKVGKSGTATFTSAVTPAVPGAILALTREPAAGATTPTMPIVALGTAIGPTS
jgi:hypothetical protein